MVLLERSVFPRNQVGESLIPHFWKFTDMTQVSDKILQEGFISKAGSVSVWGGQVHQIKFTDFGYVRPGLHVERDVFDSILLSHAASCDAQVFNEVVVKNVDFSDALSPVVSYIDKRGGCYCEGEIHCQYIVDASGYNSLLANQFKVRQTISHQLNFLSMRGYFKNSQFVGVDRRNYSARLVKQIKPVTFVMSFEQGWLWHIILRDKTSVGLVISTDRAKGMNHQQREHFFLETCWRIPHLSGLLASAEFVTGSLKCRPDYSYYSTRICGENYYCIGDAAAFVDPIFSHGIQNAFYNAAIAALAIKASLKNKKNRLRYSALCESRMQQFYGFSRALSLGDFGSHGVKSDLVKNLMKSMSPLELELILVASSTTDRSDNFRKMAREAGVLGKHEENFSGGGRELLEPLNF